MPKRQSVKRHETDEVQGEGSYVVLTGVKIREIRKVRREGRKADRAKAKLAAEIQEDPTRELTEEELKDYEFEGGISLLASHIIEWNWVDDEGTPLSLPKDDSEVTDELTNDETEFLMDLLMGSEETKN